MKPTHIISLTAWLGLALLLFGGLAAIRIHKYQHPTTLVGFGCLPSGICMARENRATLPKSTLAWTTGGYDGQFYYYLAVSLYANKSVVLDDAILRKSRIGFPLLAGLAWQLGQAEALIWSMSLVPLLIHLLAVSFVFVYFYRRNNVNYNQSIWFNRMLLATFVLNPFVLLSFLLNVADGVAIELALLGVIVLQRNRAGKIAGIVGGGLLLSLAVLSKETVLVLLPLLLIQKIPNNSNFGIRIFVGLLLPLILLFTWWNHIGFEPWHVASVHGSWPFEGFLQYLNHPDALLSGRGLLSILLPVYGILFVHILWQMLRTRHCIQNLFAVQATLLLSLVLVSLASFEYWMNFANIARLFTPLILYPFFVMSQSSERITRFLIIVISILSLLMSWVIINDVMFGKLVPTILIQ